MQVKLFSAEQTNGSLWYKFKMSDWGKIQEALPLEQLGKCLPRPKTQLRSERIF